MFVNVLRGLSRFKVRLKSAPIGALEISKDAEDGVFIIVFDTPELVRGT